MKQITLPAPTSQRGFTLVELLVVIAVIGILSGLLLVNMVGLRGRAGDTKIKNDLRQLKAALRLYYNDFQHYPEGDNTIAGCGVAGDEVCSDGFSAGASDTMYMKELPETFEYYSDGGNGFVVRGVLENLSDTDIEKSQDVCNPLGRDYYQDTGGDNELDTNEYFVCED